MPLFKTELGRHGMNMVPRSLDIRVQLVSPLIQCSRVSVAVPSYRNPNKETGTKGGGDLGVSFEDPLNPVVVHGHRVYSLTTSLPWTQRRCRNRKAGSCAVAAETQCGCWCWHVETENGVQAMLRRPWRFTDSPGVLLLILLSALSSLLNATGKEQADMCLESPEIRTRICPRESDKNQ